MKNSQKSNNNKTYMIVACVVCCNTNVVYIISCATQEIISGSGLGAGSKLRTAAGACASLQGGGCASEVGQATQPATAVALGHISNGTTPAMRAF
ncbi:MAG: hypothetical protein NTV22_20280 [bacterium]|nr:hypothetical protein [bacterium]